MGHTGSLYGPAYSLVDIGVEPEQPESDVCIVALVDEHNDAVFRQGSSEPIYMIIKVAKVTKGRYSPLKIVVYHPVSFEQIHEFEVEYGVNTAGYNEYDAWLELHEVTYKASSIKAQKTIGEMHSNTTLQVLATSVTLTSAAIKKKIETFAQTYGHNIYTFKAVKLKKGWGLCDNCCVIS